METSAQVLARWREDLWATYARLESSSDDDRFFGSVTLIVPGCTGLTIVSSTTQITERTAANIRSDSSEYVLCAYQLNGHGFAEQDGRLAETHPGQFVLYDTTRPYRLSFDGPFAQRVFRLPRKLLDRRAAGFSQMMARPFDGTRGPGVLVMSLGGLLADQRPVLDADEFKEIEFAACEFLSAALNIIGRGSGDSLDAMYRRLIGALELHLDESPIDLDRFASEQGISVRTLQRLFKRHQTTPSRWVLERRLERIAGQLRTPAYDARSITDLALSGGFNDLGHFNRAFRAHYGMTPSQWRTSR
jgi:AraC-like DNA-binding protein